MTPSPLLSLSLVYFFHSIALHFIFSGLVFYCFVVQCCYKFSKTESEANYILKSGLLTKLSANGIMRSSDD